MTICASCFARSEHPTVINADAPITSQTLDQIVDQTMALKEGSRIVILSSLVTGQKGIHDKLFKRLIKEGFTRVRVNGKTLEIEEVGKLDKNKKHTIHVVIDRLVIKDNLRSRLADSLELAMAQSDGVVMVDVIGTKPVLFSERRLAYNVVLAIPSLHRRVFP